MKPKTKVAVLGGGLSSLSTIFHLTNNDTWRDTYDITLYQLGWRLGGKCASSRDEQTAMRIEEHGLHLWFGFYDQAFAMMKKCYAEYAQEDVTLETAFTGYDHIALQELVGDTWQTWMNYIPPNNYKIGEPAIGPIVAITNVVDYLKSLIGFLQTQYTGFHSTIPADLVHKLHTNGEQLIVLAQQHNFPHLIPYFKKYATPNIDYALITLLLEVATGIVDEISQNLNIPDKYSYYSNLLLELLEFALKVVWDILKPFIDLDTIRKLWIFVDFFAISMKGFIVDGVILKGFDVINNLDLREWLSQNGAMMMTINSALVQAIYGLVFGGKNQYTFEAGTAMEGLLKMTLLYKGHVYYRMNDGMGDIIIGPLYNVLKARGVNFEFFNKVTRLVPGADGTSIDEIHIDVQATLKPEFKSYEPMKQFPDHQGLPYWPEYPRYEFLQQGEQLKHGGLNGEPVNLESYYADWKPVAQKVLKVDDHYDVVIQGISIGALPYIAKDILQRAEREDWRLMVEHIKPVPTIASQLWLKSNIEEMGWKYTQDGLALLGSYQEPYDTWSQMDQLIAKEKWPEQNKPQSLAYLVGPTPAAFADLAPFTDHTFPQRQYEMAKKFTRQYLEKLAVNIWPGTINNNNKFKWEDLVAPDEIQGEKRLDVQYFRANIDPTELYVLSEKGSSQYRLKTNECGFDNMLITGDWIDIGFNAGCVECAVEAGILTATAFAERLSPVDNTEILSLSEK